MRNWLPKAWRRTVVTSLPARLGLEVLEPRETPAAFTAGNLAVIQAEASASNTTASVIELDPATSAQTPSNTIAIDGSATATNPLRFSGSATSTLYLSRTADGSLLTFNGGNTTNTSSNINTITTRGVGTLDPDGTFALATTYTGGSGNQTRSATSLNNTDYFIADQGGIFTNSATAASPTGNVRAIKAFGGTVYTNQASSTTTTIQVATVSAATGGSITGLTGLSNNASIQDFYLIQSGDNGATYDVLYVASATSNTAGTITKFSYTDSDANGSLDTWSANGSYTTAFGGFGLAAKDNGSGALLYVSTGQGALTANSVLAVADTAGYNSTISVTTANNVTLYTAPTGKIVKGVAFTPDTLALSPASLPDADQGVSYSETLTASGGAGTYTFALASGSGLPAGLSLSTAGVISGTPTAGGTTNITVAVTDGTGARLTQQYSLTVNSNNAAPVVTTVSGATTFTENDADTAIDAGLTVTDDGTTLTGATVTIGTGFVSGEDSLTFTDQNNITGSYDSGTGVLTLSGTASVSDYETALRSVKYANTSNDPTAGDRTIEFAVNDGTDDSNTATKTVTVVAVNDAPTLTATAVGGTFTEGGTAATLFSSAAAGTVESGQSIRTLTLTVSGLSGGASEVLTIDGSSVALTDGNSLTTSGNSFSVSVSVTSGTATVTVDKTAGVSASVFNGIVNGLRYRHDGDDPTAGDRVVTITSVRDTGGTDNGGADTTTLSIASTVTAAAVNDAPDLNATGQTVTFTEGGSAAVLFTSGSVGAVESGQTFIALTLTVTNLNGGANEVLEVDGSNLQLTDGFTTTTGNGFTASVSVSSSTATVTLSKTPGVSGVVLRAVVDSLAYRHDGDAPTAGDRVVTLTSVQDSGGTANGGTDTTTLSLAATVTVVPVNDDPVVTNVDGDSQTYLTGGSAVLIDVGGDAAVADPDSANFDGGTLTVSVSGGVSTDAAGIRNQGSGSGQIGVSGSNVTFGGTTIGTFTGGTGSNLVVTFNTNATPAAVQALVRNLTLLPDGTASTATRTVTVGLTDGDGGTSNTSTATVAVDSVPQVLSITRNNNPTTTNVTTVSWTITFSQAVSGVGLEDFTLTGTGTLVASSLTRSISGGGASSTTFVYTASGIAGDGTLDLDFSAPTGVTPNAGGTFDGPAYTIDQTAPTVAFGTTPPAATNSSSATFTFTGSDPTAGGVSSGVAGFEYSVDGGAYSSAASPLNLTGLTDGSRTVRVRATDNAGNQSTPATYTFTVDTTAPTVTSFANNSSAPAVTGVAITYTVTFGEDIDAATVSAASFSNAGTASVTFGTPTETGPNTGVFTVAVTPTTTGTILLRVNSGGAADPVGNTLAASTTDTATVSVVNVAPTATFVNGGAVSEGSVGLVGFTPATDPSPLDTAAGFRYAFDFDNNGTFEVGDGTYAGSGAAASASVPANFLADGNGSRTVRAVVIDQGGAAREYFTTITVTNVAPTVALGGGAAAAEGSPYTLTLGGVTDPGQDTVTQFVVNWGDGTSSTYSSGGAKTHTYADNGSYTVSVDLTDEDGTFVNRGNAVTASIFNVAPTITAFSVPASGVGGTPISVSAAATDPAGASDPLTYIWGVLKNGAAFTSGSGQSFTFTPDDAGSYSVTLTVSDGDGGTASRSASLSVSIPYRPKVATAVGAKVSVFDPVASSTAALDPYPGFPGSVTVATADLNGDGYWDIVTGAGAGGTPHVKVFDGRTMTEVASFFAYNPSFTGGVFVAAGGGRIATGAGPGGTPHVRTFDRFGNEQSSFFAFEQSFSGGVRVAVGDLDANGVPEVVVATGPGRASEVRVFANGSTNVATSITPFVAFRGGAFVAVGGGVIAVGADTGGGPNVKTFTPAGGETSSFFAFDPKFTGGARVAFADDNADGQLDLIAAAGPGGGPNVRAFSVSPFGLLSDRTAGDPLDARGVFVG